MTSRYSRCRNWLVLCCLVLVPAILGAQASNLASGGTLPSQCRVGNVYVKTGGSAGLYVCLAANTWTGPLGTGSGTVTNAATLTASQIVVGAGGNAVATLGSLGTTTTVLHGNAAGAPTFGAVSLTADVSGNLPVAKLNSGTSASSSTFWRGDGSWAAVTPGSGGGNTINTTAIGSEPGGPSSGDVDLYSNSFYVSRYSGSAWIPWGPMFPLTAPVSGDFAWVNQGGSSVSTTNGGIFLSGPTNSGTNIRMRVKTAPAPPYTVTTFIVPLLVGDDNQECGLIFRDSGSGKLYTFGFSTNNQQRFITQYFTSATTYGGFTLLKYGEIQPTFLRIADDNTNRVMSFSNDGVNFREFYSVARTTNFTADQVGFYVNEATNSNAVGMTLLSWKES